MVTITRFVARLAMTAACMGLLPTPSSAQIRSSVFIDGLNAPVEMVPHPSEIGTMFIVQLGGLIRVWRNNAMSASPFLDLTQTISTGRERGLLGMAFAPDYATSRRVYVNFTDAAGHTVVARYTTVPGSPTSTHLADVASRFDLRWGGADGTRWIAQPYATHNGGHMVFGPDGYLYVGMGDGGSIGDPEHRAQDPNTWLGKMLRIDVNVPDTHPDGYVVPPDNPFVGGGALPEIWSFGLRNPWKFNFDTSGPGGAGTHAMLIGDVGQGAREEINYEPAGRGGRNYGWRLREGLLPYVPTTPPAYLPLTDPILDYARADGHSVTGGYVYRGTSLRSGFRGRYFFADFISGRIWSVGLALGPAGEATVTDRVEHTAELGGSEVLGNIAALSRDSLGELYVLSFNGTIFKLRHDMGSIGPIGGTPGPVSMVLPIGQVDTPAQHAAGVVGAIGITGWALDDAGIGNVRIYRNCLAGVDNPASCQTILGESVVFVGQAAFLQGARPDVEAAFASYPNADRAGWGMLILSPMLPHVPLGQLSGGQGAITLYAVATDNDGLVKLLGRSWAEGTHQYSSPTVVTLANDALAKPFGTIDTPAAAAVVSGVVVNFGWALTPDANTSVDGPSDILMPVNGSTIVVYVDGTSRGLVAFDQCRGSVGNPVPAGVFCDDDVANTFGNATPQASSTPRASNPTRFRNLDAGRGAIGAFTLDTATLSNGRHTIAWGVEDSAGRAEGLGSRFFTVQSGADRPMAALRESPVADVALDETRPSTAEVWGRTGFSRSSAWQRIFPDGDGQRHVTLPEMGRLELRFDGAPTAGFVSANGTRRELPAGSLLEADRFTWAPGPGYFGTYVLVFLRGEERVDVQVSVAPSRQLRSDEPPVRMSLDRVRVLDDGSTVSAEGWAFDTEAALGSGVRAIHVWAQSSAGAVFLGAAEVGATRPDVAAAHGAPFGAAGFGLTSAVRLPPGTYT